MKKKRNRKREEGVLADRYTLPFLSNALAREEPKNKSNYLMKCTKCKINKHTTTSCKNHHLRVCVHVCVWSVTMGSFLPSLTHTKKNRQGVHANMHFSFQTHSRRDDFHAISYLSLN